jgi:hypothetical protein
MKSTIFRLALGLIFISAFLAPTMGARPQESSPQGANPASSALDATEFATELRRIEGAIDRNHSTTQQIAQVRSSLPEQWEVTTSDDRYAISSKPLASFLERAEQDPGQRATLVADANQWLEELARQVGSYATPESPNDANAHIALGQILARREFSSLRAPSAIDRLRDEITDWILRGVEWFLQHIVRHTTSATIFFTLLLVAVVLGLGFMLIRFWMGRARFDELQAPQAVAFARSWQDWIRDARAAAERGDFREAVHSTYWAGISYLEAVEMIDPDRTRTPREYLRLLSKPRVGATTSLGRPRAALASLTTLLEQIWYGGRPASRQDFLDSMQQIEGLGCQLR